MPGWLLLQKVGNLCACQKSAGSLKGRTAYQLGKLSLFSSTYKEGSLYCFQNCMPLLLLQHLTGYFLHAMSSKPFLSKFLCFMAKIHKLLGWRLNQLRTWLIYQRNWFLKININNKGGGTGHSAIPSVTHCLSFLIGGFFCPWSSFAGCSKQNQLGREWQTDLGGFGGMSPTWPRGFLSPCSGWRGA